MLLVKEIYELTTSLPKSEQFGISSQAQRAAVSIPSNIAEGHERNNLKEYIQFLGVARGSAAELETQLLIIQEVYKYKVDHHLDLLLEIRKMLLTLVKKLKEK